MRWLPLAVLVLVLPPAVAAPVPKHLMKGESFWPTAVGTKWVYEQGGKEMIEEITKAEEVKGGLRLTVRFQFHGQWDNFVEVTPDAVIKRTNGKFVIDQQILRLPVEAGNSWKYALPQQEGLLCEGGTMTTGESEDVKVLAGTFRATKVVSKVSEVDGKPIPQPRTYTYWYAKGVGLVKVEWSGGGRELKSFTPGKK